MKEIWLKLEMSMEVLQLKSITGKKLKIKDVIYNILTFTVIDQAQEPLETFIQEKERNSEKQDKMMI